MGGVGSSEIRNMNLTGGVILLFEVGAVSSATVRHYVKKYKLLFHKK